MKNFMSLHEMIDQFLLSHKEENDLTENEKYWFQWLKEAVKSNANRKYRGIGNFVNPKYIIISESLQIPSKLGMFYGEDKPERNNIRENKYWDLPFYQRLLPFMETTKSLKFFKSLIEAGQIIKPENSWITTADKIWLNEKDSIKLLQKEMFNLLDQNKTKNIICLGSIEMLYSIDRDYLNKWINIVSELKFPSFHTTSHSIEWAEYKYEFWKIINQCND